MTHPALNFHPDPELCEACGYMNRVSTGGPCAFHLGAESGFAYALKAVAQLAANPYGVALMHQAFDNDEEWISPLARSQPGHTADPDLVSPEAAHRHAAYTRRRGAAHALGEAEHRRAEPGSIAPDPAGMSPRDHVTTAVDLGRLAADAYRRGHFDEADWQLALARFHAALAPAVAAAEQHEAGAA
ncbi:hypothetical protein L3Q67_01100 [Saccharothrix sp. AJ9571]|nr:hypothetical protein L3Q67_01100 [Saccharothrix sp. AJ9571]